MKIGKKQNGDNRIRKAAQGFGGIEPLEGRTMMTAVHLGPTPPTYALVNQTITVTNTNASGSGSLNAAIAAADSSPFLNVTINFQLPKGSVIPETSSAPLPAIYRNNVTIDATSLLVTQANGQTTPGVTIKGNSVFGFYLNGASGCAINGIGFANEYDAIGVYGGTNDGFSQIKTENCNVGITLDAYSNHDSITSGEFDDSVSDGIYVGGSNNQIGIRQSAAGPFASVQIKGVSQGNGIEVASSTNFIVGTYVYNCAKDGIVLDSGSTGVYIYDDIVEQDTATPHGSCIDVLAGANGNHIGDEDTAADEQALMNRITYTQPSRRAGTASESYAIKVLGTGNTIENDRINGTGTSHTPSTTGPAGALPDPDSDLYIVGLGYSTPQNIFRG